MNLELSDDEKATLIRELDQIIQDDRQPLSPRPPNVLLRAVAIANDRVQPNPILRSDSDGNSLAHHRHSHKTEPSETLIWTLLSGAIH
jgi:hypothetical protein